MRKIFLFVSILLILGISSTYAKDIQKAYFAGGCFWCMEGPFEKLEGVREVYSGYIGPGKKPTYAAVSKGKTPFIEGVEIIYDADVIDYQTLLNVFWRQVDPTDDGGQFVDRGPHYRTLIAFKSEEEKKLAEQSKNTLNKSGWLDAPVVTEIVELTNFYKAEDYHQDYYKKSSKRYKIYRKGSGRDRYLDSVWGKKIDPTTAIKKKK